MALPPSALLVAAVHWLIELRDNNRALAYSTLTSAPAYRGTTPTQYMTAYDWLESTGLLNDPALRFLQPELLAEAVLQRATFSTKPPWLADADLNIREPDQIPDDALTASDALGLTPARCLEVIRICHVQADQEERARIGIAGELAVMKFLEQTGMGAAIRVSALSDAYGYDVEWQYPAGLAHLEVKATGRRGRLTIHLSRHEFEVSSRDPHWALIIVHVGDQDQPTALVRLSTSWIHSNAPKDSTLFGRWESVILNPPRAALSLGLGTPLPSLIPATSPLVTGFCGDAQAIPAWLPA